MFVFSETEAENYSFLQPSVCVSIASPRVHYTKPLQQKKNWPRIFSKTARTFLIYFSWKWERKKWGSPCSFLLNEQNCLSVSYRRWHNRQTSHMAITHNLVQFKTVASNRLAMAQSLELWTLDPLDRDSLPVQQGSLPSDVTTGSSYLKYLGPQSFVLSKKGVFFDLCNSETHDAAWRGTCLKVVDISRLQNPSQNSVCVRFHYRRDYTAHGSFTWIEKRSFVFGLAIYLHAHRSTVTVWRHLVYVDKDWPVTADSLFHCGSFSSFFFFSKTHVAFAPGFGGQTSLSACVNEGADRMIVKARVPFCIAFFVAFLRGNMTTASVRNFVSRKSLHCKTQDAFFFFNQ